MEVVVQLKLGISRHFSTGSDLKKIGYFIFHLQSSLNLRLSNTNRFIFGRQARAPSPRRQRLISQRSLRILSLPSQSIRSLSTPNLCSSFEKSFAVINSRMTPPEEGDLERKMKKEHKKLEDVGSR